MLQGGKHVSCILTINNEGNIVETEGGHSIRLSGKQRGGLVFGGKEVLLARKLQPA